MGAVGGTYCMGNYRNSANTATLTQQLSLAPPRCAGSESGGEGGEDSSSSGGDIALPEDLTSLDPAVLR